MKTFIPLTAIFFLMTPVCFADTAPKGGGRHAGGHRGHHHGHHGRHHGRHHHHHPRGYYGGDVPFGPPPSFVADPFAPADTTFMIDPLIGEAEVIRSIGEYNRNTSEALINLEEARQRAIQNHRLRVETRNELKRQWKEQRVAEFRRRRALQLEQSPQTREEDRLDRDEFNRRTGQIVWPDVLLDPQFDDYRAAFEEIFGQAPGKPSGAGSDLHRDVTELTKLMKEQLRLQISFMQADDYLAAKKFIDGLLVEARRIQQPSGSDSAFTMFQ